MFPFGNYYWTKTFLPSDGVEAIPRAASRFFFSSPPHPDCSLKYTEHSETRDSPFQLWDYTSGIPPLDPVVVSLTSSLAYVDVPYTLWILSCISTKKLCCICIYLVILSRGLQVSYRWPLINPHNIAYFKITILIACSVRINEMRSVKCFWEKRASWNQGFSCFRVLFEKVFFRTSVCVCVCVCGWERIQGEKEVSSSVDWTVSFRIYSAKSSDFS